MTKRLLSMFLVIALVSTLFGGAAGTAAAQEAAPAPVGPEADAAIIRTTEGAFVPADSIRAGDRILFVDRTAGKAAGPLAGTGSSTYLTAVDATLGEGTAASAEALVFDVEEGTAAGTFAFKYGENYLTASKASSSSNYLYLTATEKSADTDWTVTFSDDTADVSYCSSTAANGRHLRYNVNNYNPRFSGYTSSGNTIRDVSIYKLESGQDLVDVYFVDQDDNAEGWLYAYGSGVENAPFPGEVMTAEGYDEHNDNYYKITLDRNVYTNVIFSGGSNQSQTGNLGLGEGSAIVYYVSGCVGYVGSDVWPGPGVVTAPTCTEGGSTVFTGLLTGVQHETDVQPAMGHAWSAWSSLDNNTHYRVCGNDASHIEKQVCSDANGDYVCDVCQGTIHQLTGEAVESGVYVLAAKVDDVYYALPRNAQAGNPAGEPVEVVDGAVSARDARDYAYAVTLLLNGDFSIDDGSKLLGCGNGSELLREVDKGGAVPLSCAWSISPSDVENGAYRIRNAATAGSETQRALSYHSSGDESAFGAYIEGLISENSAYCDLWLIPVSGSDSPEDIDIYFVDEIGVGSAYVYYSNVNNLPVDSDEDLQYPGEAQTALGVDKGGHPYYLITVPYDTFTHVCFNNGLAEGAEGALRTANLDFAADAQEDPLNPEGHRFVVYYVHWGDGNAAVDTGTDVWPSPKVVTLEPTCTEPGEQAYVGLRTGVPLEPEELQAQGHDWGEWQADHAPNCTEPGMNYRTCGRCGAVEQQEVEELGHLPGEAVQENYTAPGCLTIGGYDTVVYCQRCNAELSRAHTELSALGHDWGDWQVDHAPTCTDMGVNYRVCNRCGAMEQEDVSELGHLPGEAVQENYTAPGCLTIGGYDTVVYCQRCNVELSRAHTELSALGHDWGEWQVDHAPTCTDLGVNYRVCNRCSTMEQEDVPALGHLPGEAVQENYVEPTATADGGYDTVVYCQRCSAELSREHTVLPATGPTEPVLDTSLRIFTSLSLGIEITETLSVRKGKLDNYPSWYFQVEKLDSDGSVLETKRYGEGQEYDVTIGANGAMYDAVFTDITAKEMGVSYVASIHCFDAEGNEFYNVNEATSFKEEIIKELLNTGNNDITHTLCADLLNYGAAAQIYFGYDVDNLVNENLSAEAAAAKEHFETTAEAAADLDNTISANMECSVSVMNRVMVSIVGRRLNAGDAVVTFEVRDSEGNVRAVLDTVKRGSAYVADYAGLEAEDMREPFTFTALVDGAARGEPVIWSLEGYVKEGRAIDLSTLDPETQLTKQKELALLNALLVYVDSAALNGSWME